MAPAKVAFELVEIRTGSLNFDRLRTVANRFFRTAVELSLGV